jgi:hypothetical protein
MGKIGGGKISPMGGAKVVTLTDSAGTDALIIKDSDGFPVAKIDSKGNLKLKGMVGKI